MVEGFKPKISGVRVNRSNNRTTSAEFFVVILCLSIHLFRPLLNIILQYSKPVPNVIDKIITKIALH